MARILIPLIFLLQGIPVQQGGTVKGILRDQAGMPAPGVRMAAVARPDSLENISDGTAMAGIAVTDEEGRYTLENIPPGRYMIAAGRLDLQTYYPGTQDMAAARVVVITAGSLVTDIDFVLNNTSFGRSSGFGSSITSATFVPWNVSAEGGARIPVSMNGRLVTVRFEMSNGNIVSVPLDQSTVTIPNPGNLFVRVTVEGLPDNYAVKSIRYGTTDVTGRTFRLGSAPPAATALPVPPSSPPTGTTTPAIAQLRAATAQLQAMLSAMASPAPSTSQLFIELTARPVVPGRGSRVAGFVGATGRRLIYISGTPGIVYADGAFEFRNVPPGRHVIATVNNPSTSMPRAAIVVVGDGDVNGVELKETPLLPADIREPKEPLPAGDYPPGSIVPLARVRVTVLEESTKEPIGEGAVVLKVEPYSRSIPIDGEGQVETLSLVPGSYDLRFEIFAHTTVGPTVVVEDKDIDLQVTSRRLY